MLDVTIKCKASNFEEAVIALHEVINKIRLEYRSGHQFSDDSSYTFHVGGEEEINEDED